MKLNPTIRAAFVRAVMDDVPKVDYGEEARTLAGTVLTNAAMTALGCSREALAEWVPRQYLFMAPGLSDVVSYGRCSKYDVIERFHPELHARLQEMSMLSAEQEISRTKLRDQLKSVAASVTTSAALIKLLPEFEKYLPTESQPTRNLPALANIVADFVSAGWPKSTGAAP